MGKKRDLKCAVLLILGSLVLGCCQCRAYDRDEMMALGAAVTQLSTAVEGQVRYNKQLPPDIGGDELLALVKKNNSHILEPFKDYTVKVLVQDKHAVVLVCTKDGKTGLLEDAGCTAPLDKHLWEVEPKAPCEFTMKVNEACGH